MLHLLASLFAAAASLAGLLIQALAGLITHTARVTWTGQGSATSTGIYTSSADGEDNRSFVVPAGTTDMQIDLDFVYTRLKMLYIKSDQDLTLETNSTNAVGGDTIAVKEAGPYLWVSSDGTTNPLTTSVTTTYWTNATAEDAAVFMSVLYDSSP